MLTIGTNFICWVAGFFVMKYMLQTYLLHRIHTCMHTYLKLRAAGFTVAFLCCENTGLVSDEKRH